jgi:hypothetical protein
MSNKLDYYGTEMEERRKTFNAIINGINMVLMNNIPEVDPSVYDNWEDRSPMNSGAEDCDIMKKKKQWYCLYHDDYCDASLSEDKPEQCDASSDDYAEVYQWFAVGGNDADYLKRHNQYITYSDLLDTYFLAICHCGTSWDYVDSMVNDILEEV